MGLSIKPSIPIPIMKLTIIFPPPRVLVGGEVVATSEFSVGKDDADVVIEVG